MITEHTLEQLLARIKAQVVSWFDFKSGTFVNNYDRESGCFIGTEDAVNSIREDKLTNLLVKEIELMDNQWLNYDREELEVKLDIADMITLQLIEELVKEFYEIETSNF